MLQKNQINKIQISFKILGLHSQSKIGLTQIKQNKIYIFPLRLAVSYSLLIDCSPPFHPPKHSFHGLFHWMRAHTHTLRQLLLLAHITAKVPRMVNLPKVTQLAGGEPKFPLKFWSDSRTCAHGRYTAVPPTTRVAQHVSHFRFHENVMVPLPVVKKARRTRWKRNSPNLQEHCNHLEIEESSPARSTMTAVITADWNLARGVWTI